MSCSLVPRGPGRDLSPAPWGKTPVPAAPFPPAPTGEGSPGEGCQSLPGRALCRCWGPCSCLPELSPAPRPPPWPAAWARPQPAARRRPPLSRRHSPHGPSPPLAARCPAWSPRLCSPPAAATAINSVAARPRPSRERGRRRPPLPRRHPRWPRPSEGAGCSPHSLHPSLPARSAAPHLPPAPCRWGWVAATLACGPETQGPGPAEVRRQLAVTSRRSKIAAGGGRRAVFTRERGETFRCPTPAAGSGRRRWLGLPRRRPAAPAAAQVCAEEGGAGAAGRTQPPVRVCNPGSAHRSWARRLPGSSAGWGCFYPRLPGFTPHAHGNPHTGRRASQVPAQPERELRRRLQCTSRGYFSSFGVTLGSLPPERAQRVCWHEGEIRSWVPFWVLYLDRHHVAPCYRLPLILTKFVPTVWQGRGALLAFLPTLSARGERQLGQCVWYGCYCGAWVHVTPAGSRECATRLFSERCESVQ